MREKEREREREKEIERFDLILFYSILLGLSPFTKIHEIHKIT